VKIKIKLFLTIISVFLVLAVAVGLECKIITQSMWDFLVVNETPKSVDVIIVLSGGTGRVDEGIKLYQMGYANEILFSGVGAPSMVREAESLGIPENHILLEDESDSTFENAKYSSEIMKAKGFTSAIIVTSPYHTRRAMVIFGQFFKKQHFIVCYATFDPSISSGWWKNQTTRIEVLTEYLKLGLHYILPDT